MNDFLKETESERTDRLSKRLDEFHEEEKKFSFDELMRRKRLDDYDDDDN